MLNLLWPNPSIQKGQSERFVVLENKNIFEGKITPRFLSYLVLQVSKNKDNLNFWALRTKKISFSYILRGCPPTMLELKEKFVNTFYEYVMQNTLMFHS